MKFNILRITIAATVFSVILGSGYPPYDPTKTYHWEDGWVSVGDCYYAVNALIVPPNTYPGSVQGIGYWITTQPSCPCWGNVNCNGGSEQHDLCGDGLIWNAQTNYKYGDRVEHSNCCYTPSSKIGVSAGLDNIPGQSCQWTTTNPECPGYNCNHEVCGQEFSYPDYCGPIWQSTKPSAYKWGTWVRWNNNCCYTPASPNGSPVPQVEPGTTDDWITTDPACPGYNFNFENGGNSGNNNETNYCGGTNWVPNTNYPLFSVVEKTPVDADFRCCYVAFPDQAAATDVPGISISWVKTDNRCPGPIWPQDCETI